MGKKEEFKIFAKENPLLLKYVKNGEMTWQKFYEMFDLYGKDNEVWNKYLEKKEVKEENTSNSFLSLLKQVNLDSVEETMQSLSRVIGVIGDLAAKKEEPVTKTYKPRPLYKHFDD